MSGPQFKTQARRPIQLSGERGWRRRWGSQFRVGTGALCDFYTRVDRVLGGRKHGNVVVELAKTDEFPSATDGTTVWLQEDAVVDAVEKRGTHLMSLFGLNFHELAHVLYTPQLNLTTKRWLMQNTGRPMAFNVLEDMRIEHLIRQQYPKMTIYFLATCYKYYFDVPLYEWQKSWQAYICMAERRYIPREDRQLARDLLVSTKGEEVAAEVERIEAEYVKLATLGAYDFLLDDAKKLIDDLVAVLGGVDVQAVQLCQDQSHSEMSGFDSKKKAPSAASFSAIYEELEGDDSNPLEKRSAGATGKREADKAVKQGTKPKSWLNNKGKRPAGGYSNNRPTGSATATFIEEQFETMVDVQRDMQHVNEVLTRAEFNLDKADDQLYKNIPVTAPMRKRRDEFVRKLMQVQEAVDPGWDPYQAQGKLNIGRAMRDEPFDTLFDDWREDRSDALDVEAKLLLDMSGSMGNGSISEMSKAFWVVSSALNRIDAKIDQIGYSDWSIALRQRGEVEVENTYRSYGTIGGTNPRVGIAKSLYDFRQSKARHKLFVLLTDGAFNADSDEDIREMRERLGVTTVMVYVSQPYDGYSHNPGTSHQCEHKIAIKTGESLSDFITQLVNRQAL
jgi:hypothetical protein